jgi:Ni/Fe-hydrogenase subunit HybB-like protein/Fe-S-cluster-containing dehydrogenase component
VKRNQDIRVPLPRRRFLQIGAGGVAAAATATFARDTAHDAGGEESGAPADPFGVLVDLGACIGCRRCEHACKQANGIEPGKLESYDDQSVFRIRRRPQPDAFTVVNAWPSSSASSASPGASAASAASADKPVFAKINCLNCNRPACVSACIVGALQKEPTGAVTYDAWKCIGCRYCMVACPFQIPAYEYDNALTPRVRKCSFCHERLEKGERPACVAACPRDVLTFGRRDELLSLAHSKISAHPDRYIDHVYGEHEVGGTSWMYLSPTPVAFSQVGFLEVGTKAPSELTEEIQHGVFKHWIAPIGWYGFLATMFWWTSRRPVVAHGSAQTHHAAQHHDDFAPVRRKLLTPGVIALIGVVLVGIAFGLYRLVAGLGASTNLDQQHPWGLWIAMDVGSGIALAGGGFVTAALAHVFHRHRYHAIARSALLTALLGYTFYVPGLLADLGRWYNIWHPTLPMMWQGNSVLFEVGICVMLYLNVQYLELAPIICERLQKDPTSPRLARFATFLKVWLERLLPALLIGGVALSTFHQSSLGNLMVIAPYKLHPLWWTPLSPLLFLLSAMMVGFPMVIFTLLFASWCLRREPEMDALGGLASRFVPVFLWLYLAVKLGDMAWRGTHVYLLDGSYQGILWIAEVFLGVVVPLGMFLAPSVRRSPKLLATASLLVIFGVVLNRLNCFILAYHPPYATRTYIPSLTEFAVSAGLVAALMLTYRVAVTYLPILSPRQKPVVA